MVLLPTHCSRISLGSALYDCVLQLEDWSGFWMLWEFFSSPGPMSCQWSFPESRGMKSSTFPQLWFSHVPLQLSAFSSSSCWEVHVGTFFWIIRCWILGFYCVLDELSLWTGELQRLKILSIDFCSCSRYCICRKFARKHSRFLRKYIVK